KDGAPAGAAKAGSTAGDNVRQESSKNLVGTGDSPGLTRSTSLGGLGRHVEARGSSFSSVAAAGVRTLGKLATTVLKGPLIPTIGKITGHVAHAPSFYNLRRRWNKLLDSTVNTRGIFGSIYGKLSSNFIRNIIMASAIFGTFFFIFCYNMSYGLKSGSPKRKQKKKIFEHNYYEEYENELAMYDSQNESLDSQEDRYYLNYQPERYYYY
ncbi:VIR-like CYIR protein, partial [Plasmodium cynomolgi strain B]